MRGVKAIYHCDCVVCGSRIDVIEKNFKNKFGAFLFRNLSNLNLLTKYKSLGVSTEY